MPQTQAPAPDPTAAIEPQAPSEAAFSFENLIEDSIKGITATEPEPTPTPAAAPPSPTTMVDPITDPAAPAAPAATPDPAAPATPDPAAPATPDPTVVPESFDPTADLNVNTDAWTPKAAAAFERVKGENKVYVQANTDLQTQLQTREARIAELEALNTNNDVEDMRTQLAEYENRTMLTNLESTNAFKEAVTKPVEALMSKVDGVAERNGLNYDDIAKAVAIADKTEQDQAFAEVLAGVSDRDKAVIYQVANEIDPILERRTELLANAKEAIAEADLLTEQEQSAALAEKALQRGNFTRTVASRIQNKLPFLAAVEGLDMDAISTEVSSIDPTTLHGVDLAYNAIASRLLPHILKLHANSQREAENLTAELAKYADATPSISAGGHTSSAAAAAAAGGGFLGGVETGISR